MKKISVFLGIACMALSMISIKAQSAEYNKNTAKKAFRRADIINDGRVDIGEFDMYHLRVFQTLDTNKDRALSKNECIGSCFTPRPGNEDAAESGIVFYKFEAIDLDKSGEIADTEYILYAREHFPEYDRNNDNIIDLDEFCTFYSLSLPCTFVGATDRMGK